MSQEGILDSINGKEVENQVNFSYRERGLLHK